MSKKVFDKKCFYRLVESNENPYCLENFLKNVECNFNSQIILVKYECRKPYYPKESETLYTFFKDYIDLYYFLISSVCIFL